MSKKEILIAAVAITLCMSSAALSDPNNGEQIFLSRCAMCHGKDLRGTGILAKKSNPPTPDLSTSDFKRRLVEYPGVIVSSIILRPNGDLIPKTLRENNVHVPSFAWTVKDFRDLNEYMVEKITHTR